MRKTVCKFKAGDVVIFRWGSRNCDHVDLGLNNNSKGRVISIASRTDISFSVLVEFYEQFDKGHSGDGLGKNKQCRWFTGNDEYVYDDVIHRRIRNGEDISQINKIRSWKKIR